MPDPHDAGLKPSRVLLAAKGFCMGAADVVPGVSGGTMAFVLGIYSELIESIRRFDARWIVCLLSARWREALLGSHVRFLLPLAAGIASALLFFTRVVPVPELLQRYPEIIYSLFFGLVAGSIVVLIREFSGLRPREWAALGLAAVAGYFVFTMVPVETPDAPWFIFLCGALAISAMLLPGISGSFVLLILRKYSFVFGAIGRFEFTVLIPFLLGVAAGLIAFSRVLAWLLQRWYRGTTAAIAGLLVASLWVIWPFQDRGYELVGGSLKLVSSSPVLPDHFGTAEWLSLAMVIVGFAAVLGLQWLAQRRRVRPGGAAS